MTNQEQYKIALNISARIGRDGDLIGEFGKAMSLINGLQTYNELNPPVAPLQAPQAPIPGQPMAGATSGQMPANVPQNV